MPTAPRIESRFTSPWSTTPSPITAAVAPASTAVKSRTAMVVTLPPSVRFAIAAATASAASVRLDRELAEARPEVQSAHTSVALSRSASTLAVHDSSGATAAKTKATRISKSTSPLLWLARRRRTREPSLGSLREVVGRRRLRSPGTRPRPWCSAARSPTPPASGSSAVRTSPSGAGAHWLHRAGAAQLGLKLALGVLGERRLQYRAAELLEALDRLVGRDLLDDEEEGGRAGLEHRTHLILELLVDARLLELAEERAEAGADRHP